MEPQGIHELTAAYALNALDPAEEAEYEEHLRHCPQCREELTGFQETTAALAYAVEGPAPPPGLRDRIVDAALAERPNVVPMRRRALPVALGAAAAVAAGVAIALGIWASSLSSSLDDERAARAQESERGLADQRSGIACTSPSRAPTARSSSAPPTRRRSCSETSSRRRKARPTRCG